MSHQYQQFEHSECGLVCLAYASAKLGAHLDMAELRRQFPISSRGLDLKQMTTIAAALDMMARAVRCEVEELGQLKLPAILHWNFKHFVVLEKVGKDFIVIHDPGQGRVKFAMELVGKRFTGVALELSEAPGFKPRRQPSPLSIWAWIRFTPTLSAGLTQTLLLSLMLQAYVLASPFYMQLAIDQAALKGDAQLLLILAVGFGVFGLFNAVASFFRGLIIQQLSTHLSWDMSLRLFKHLVRLPLDWFQKRKLADTISRLDSINPIRDLVSGSLISTLIDGLLAITTLIMMVIFAWPLALVALLAVLIFVVIRVSSLSTSMRLSSEVLGAQIAENGKRIETVKAIQTIKTMAAEDQQEVQWSNKYSTVLKKKIASNRFQISVTAVQQSFDMLSMIVVTYLGVREVLDHKITIGVLYAFTAYRGQFSSAISNVVEQFIQWKLSDIYSFRLADIVLTPKEANIDRVENIEIAFEGKIELENLTFRYSAFEPFVFKNINLTINAGDFVAIVGPSGVGKSTMLKLMCGLYTATSGEIRIDGRPISTLSPKTFRDACGTVMQDDELLSGTIADNVAFFDDNIDMDRVWKCLESAAMRDEILAMPMKADTSVGDMGGNLSGGQKQRLLIARALYKQPSILFFDEATSHLDVANETAINNALRALKVTRVVIAHRNETITAADYLFDLRSGQVLRKRPQPGPDQQGATSPPGLAPPTLAAPEATPQAAS